MRLSEFRHWVGLAVLLCNAVLLARLPIATTTTRLAQVATFVALWLFPLWLVRKRRALVVVMLAPALILVGGLVLPGRPVNASSLRARYVASLQSYDGAPYVWGGENDRGIDCSGLVRKALILAEAREGLATLNPALVRDASWMWAHDSSARELRGGYSGRTAPLFPAGTINDADQSKLLPGDFAVTQDGTHTLAFTGGHGWIEADPESMRVKRWQTPAWHWSFREPVQLMRWKVFENATGK